jgi:hypothetical protein
MVSKRVVVSGGQWWWWGIISSFLKVLVMWNAVCGKK